MNKGFAMGFISSEIKESEVNTKNGAMKKARFSIGLQKQGGADFPSFVAIGKNAENIIKWFEKGKGIYVEYHISTGSYTDKDGKKVYTTDLVVDRWEFPPIRKNEQEQPSASDTPSQPQESQPQEHATNPNDFIDVPEDIENDLPFR